MSPEHAPAPEGSAHAPSVRLGLFLEHVGRSLRRAAAIEGAVVVLAGLLVAIITGALVSLAGGSIATIASIELVVIAGVLAFVILRYARVIRRALRGPSAVAAWLDGAIARHGVLPAERVGLLSAVELTTDRGRFGESARLGDAAIADATDSALRIDSDAIVKKEAWASLRTMLLVLSGSAVVLGGLGLFTPKHVLASLSAISALGRLENPLSPAAPEPRFGDFRITYRYPAYADRAQAVVTEPNGDLLALPGTEVVIETNARDDLVQGTLVVSFGEGNGNTKDTEQQRINVEVEGRHLRATMVVSRAGRYRFHLKTEAGEVQEERRGHAIELELDEPPAITQLAPEESPLEVNEKDRLSLAFDASDDYGLGDVYFAWRVMGTAREGKQKVTSSARGSRHWAGTEKLDLAPLGFKPGDRVAYTLEAHDNDTVNGPKIGASMTRELRIYSKSTHHEQVMALQEQALDELVHILGDNLETTFDVREKADEYAGLLDASERMVERATAADELLKKVVAASKKDPLGRPQVADAFETARVQLQRDARRQRSTVSSARRAFTPKRAIDAVATKAGRAAQDLMITSLEKNVVYLGDLLNDQRMIDAEALAKELRQAQQDLKKALEEYKNSPDPEKRKQLMTAIKEIKERINTIMQQLAKQQATIPQDFVNQDALKTDEAQASMDEVQRKIEEGDLDGAMKELDEMLGQTEKMLAELQGGREEMGSREYSEVQETAERMWQELQEVEREQRELASKTERTSREVMERMQQRLGDPQAFVDKQKKRLDQVKEALERARPGSKFVEGDNHDQAERRVNDGARAMEAKDFGAAREMVEEAAQLMEQLEQEAERRAEQARRFGDLFGSGDAAERAERELRRARPVLEDVLRDIERLMPSPESLLSDDERRELAKQKERQQALEKRAQQIGQDLERIGQELPIVGPETKQMLDEATGAMGQASQKLGQGDAPGALNQERRAADALGRLKQELEKMGSKGGGSQGGGIPLPFGQQPEGGGEDDRGMGSRDNPSAKVEIPKPEQFKAPAEFREDILEAAKQGTVEDYRDAVRRYYEELVK
ncbi:DUF4175 domain-containing protein [Myxococcota bacterium]|nr:DUF4175 domain-containing protein [Myxococcota bacterium]